MSVMFEIRDINAEIAKAQRAQRFFGVVRQQLRDRWMAPVYFDFSLRSLRLCDLCVDITGAHS